MVIPRTEILRKGLREGQRVQVSVEPLKGPDGFSDLAGTVTWRRKAQEYKDELRRLSGA